MSEGFRTFDHTGDLGLEVWAETPERLFGLAAEAVLAQVASPRVDADEVTAVVSLDGDDPSDLLVHWLNTALLEASVRRAVWTHAHVTRLESRAVEARLTGPRFDPRRQITLREIKAVSHHHLDLRLVPPDCRCRLVLDL